MNLSTVKYKTKTANEEDIYSHLTRCNENFSPPLNTKVDIREYANKIFNKSVTFEAWKDDILIGLVAVYFNDLHNQTGFITNASLIKKYMNKGIASELMNICIQYAKQYNFKEINLEVHKDNSPAIRLYKKFGFMDFETKDDLIVMKLKGLLKK